MRRRPRVYCTSMDLGPQAQFVEKAKLRTLFVDEERAFAAAVAVVDDLRRCTAALALSGVPCCMVDCVRRHFLGAVAAAAEQVTDALCACAAVTTFKMEKISVHTECVNSSVAMFARHFLCKFLLQFSSCLAAQQL